jgi:CBS domain containing-hemolysin-like protein
MSIMLIPLVMVAILLTIHGIFVAAEFSLIGTRPSRLKEMTEKGDPHIERMVLLLDDSVEMDSFITAAQFGITLASLALGMGGVYSIAAYLQGVFVQWGAWTPLVAWGAGFFVALSVMTLLLVVVGNVIPKSLALHHPERILLGVNGFLRLMRLVFLPLIILLNGFGNVVLRVLNIPRIESHRRLYSPEELALVVMESHKGGMLSDDEQRIIQNIFDLSERRVGQVMTPRPRIEAIPVDIGEQELRDYIATSPYSRFPVYEHDLDHIVGLLLVKDFVQQQLEQPDSMDLKSLLRHMPAVPEAMMVDRLLAAFKHSHIHMALVFDEYGGTAGVVTLEDVVEEVVGEVHDEFDEVEQPLLYEVEPGMFFARGDLMLDDLEDAALGILPDDEDEELPDVDTVGGLVVSLLGRPAVPGDQVAIAQTLFIVESVSGFAVDMVRIIYPGDGDEDEVDNEREAGRD